jgi:hypothetical protein
MTWVRISGQLFRYLNRIRISQNSAYTKGCKLMTRELENPRKDLGSNTGKPSFIRL